MFLHVVYEKYVITIILMHLRESVWETWQIQIQKELQEAEKYKNYFQIIVFHFDYTINQI